jgi:suppressor for copper-sensitivity B
MTCKVNERTTFSDTNVVSALNADTVAMKADWTKPDTRIASYLADHGRYGIPFTVLVGRGGKELVLPELLTPDRVLAAIKDLKS